MKIKFLKEFRLYNPIGDDMMMGEGAIENMEKEDYAQWLIDNGLAEEVKESGWWKPEHGETYWCLNSDGDACQDRWLNYKQDRTRTTIGNVFRTKEAAERYRDYLKAIATVRQDEGVLTSKEVESTERSSGNVWCIAYTFDSGLLAHTCPLDEMLPQTGAIYFNSLGHANDSLSNHPDEWKIIANYDWSRE